MLEIWLQDGIGVVLWLQSLGSWLDAPMAFFTFLGNEEFFLLIMPALYWCLDSALGLRLGVILLVSGNFNSAFKLLGHAPRPFWYDNRVAAYDFAGSFGLPSGHAQNAVAMWGLLAAEIRRSWAWIGAVIVILMIGISRIYLAVHFPVDVIAGWLIGLALLLGFLALRSRIFPEMGEGSSGILPVLFVVAVLVPLALGAWVVFTLSAGGWHVPLEWIENARAAFPGEEFLDPLRLEGLVTTSGSLAGLLVGGSWIRARGGFDAGGPLTSRALRYVIGVVGVVVIRVGLGALFPEGESVLALSLRFVRYTLITLWVIGLAPLAFRRLGLAGAVVSPN